jgi:putative acetyltransferase
MGMKVQITERRPDAPDALVLITELQTHLESLYPPTSRHGFSVDRLIAESVAFFVVSVDGEPAGCGGIKIVDGDYGELKRMYVRPRFRGAGLGRMILEELARYAQSRAVNLLRLETGVHHGEAIRLYERCGFYRISAFGPYSENPDNLFYEKRLTSDAS